MNACSGSTKLWIGDLLKGTVSTVDDHEFAISLSKDELTKAKTLIRPTSIWTGKDGERPNGSGGM